MAYRAFLVVMGKEGGSFTKEIPHLWEYLKYYREWANEILQEFKSNYQLPKNAFVFSCQDNWFSFFILDEGDDPPVYAFSETFTEPAFQCHNLTELFWSTTQYVIDVIDWRNKHRTRDDLTIKEQIYNSIMINQLFFDRVIESINNQANT